MADEAQGHQSNSGGFDTFDGKVVPIVFVPGVMGSRLRIKNAPNWDPDNLVSFGQFPFLGQEVVARVLSADNEAEVDLNLSDAALTAIKNNTFVKSVPGRLGKPPKDDDALRLFFEQRGWGSVVHSFYGQLFLTMEQRLNEKTGGVPYPVYAVGYDWRQSNVDSGVKLKASIKSIIQEHRPAAQKVVIVTHSMGGLVTLSAHQDGLKDLVGGAVHCVMPSTGAAVAYRRFQTGASLQFDGPPEAASNKDWIAAAFLNSIMGTTREEYALTQCGLKGPLQLLPSNNYPDNFLNMLDNDLVKNNREVNDIYEIYLRDVPPGIVPKRNDDNFLPPLTRITQADVDRLKRNIRLARDFHNRISRPLTALTDTFLIIGDAVTTDVEFDWLKGDVMEREDFDQKVTQAPFGDGTVPAVSAEFRFANPAPRNRDPNINPRTLNTNSIFNGAQHAVCYAAPGFTDKVIRSVQALIPKAKA